MNPPEKKRLPASPEEWLGHAKSDLKLSRLGKESKDVLPQQICFHAQQAVEKTFKAALRFRIKIPFPSGLYKFRTFKDAGIWEREWWVKSGATKRDR